MKHWKSLLLVAALFGTLTATVLSYLSPPLDLHPGTRSMQTNGGMPLIGSSSPDALAAARGAQDKSAGTPQVDSRASNAPKSSNGKRSSKGEPYTIDYPLGLAATLELATRTSDGRLAYELAGILGRCASVDRELEYTRNNLGRIADSQLQSAMARQTLTMQSFSNECAASGIDFNKAELAMYALAAAKHVFDAAASAYLRGSKTTQMAERVLRDARNGSITSLGIMAADNAIAPLGLEPDEKAAFRAALEMAAREGPHVSQRAKWMLEMGQSRQEMEQSLLAEAAGAKPVSKDAVKQYPPAVEAEARRLLAKILERNKALQGSAG
ncbi:hypothetical protein [Pelomonas sp. SE-A7]|uniref:hypothetical protein n=1 Tax=Pelomonas sp. SE-A7 TaxID=3054953 RepID=UPI00259C6B5E|nr:hypothetical protein [Pelomonas sp. SE-A7]MDM4766483.1 hypothetical protein [Pelomonas sp. SE-A7]